MKNLVLLLTALLIMSCTAIQQTEIKTVGSIARPEVDIEFKIKLDEKNIIELGKINETVEYVSPQGYSLPGSTSSTTIEKSAYITNLLTKDAGIAQIRMKNQAWFDYALGDIAYKCLSIYPDMDYILFPKIIVESLYSSDTFKYQYKMKFTGTAVQIQLKNK